MARKKISAEGLTINTYEEIANLELSQALGDAFNLVIKRDFGNYVAPSPIITPTNIIPLDYLLGGGIVSSKPVMISSTPETGKSTFCFQFSKLFQQQHENGVVVYLDIEGAGNMNQSNDFGMSSRIETFELNNKSFQYQPVILTVSDVFGLIQKLAAIKQAFEEKLKKEFYILIIWDSLSATRSGKTDLVDDVNQQIGYKARELTFMLEKFSPMIAFKRMTLVIVDQVRANLKSAIDGPYAPKERSVGNFNDFRAATTINSLNHLTGQWLYFSKKKTITVVDGMGIDGWEINVSTEKNKNAPSQYTITCIFDKINGFDKFWSEYRFMSELCPSEMKIFKKSEKNLTYPLTIKQNGPQVKLKVVDEDDQSNTLYESKSMYKKDMSNLYDTDSEFRQWFDYAVELSAKNRILGGLFKCQTAELEDEISINEDIMDVLNVVSPVGSDIVDTKTGEIISTDPDVEISYPNLL
jgi:archaellum biogenesis ATPase FlaH